MDDHAGTGPAVPGVTTLADLERQAILAAIRTLHGDKLQAARLLGIGKTTLYRKLKEYGIADPMQDEGKRQLLAVNCLAISLCCRGRDVFGWRGTKGRTTFFQTGCRAKVLSAFDG